jgi:prepilin-type N-terminal cleavage/methylation domain-containing protein
MNRRLPLPPGGSQIRAQKGFTLMELLIVVTVIGIFASVMGGYVSEALSFTKQNYVLDQSRINRELGRTLLEWSARYANGRLPAPYNDPAGGPTTRSGLFDPAGLTSADPDVQRAAVAFVNLASAKGIALSQINLDGLGAPRMRAYQRVQGQTLEIPFFGFAGDRVTVTFDVGVIYQTRCHLDDTLCNPNPATGLPGASAAMTPGNYAAFQAADDDFGLIKISTLDLQRAQLELTAYRITTLREGARSYFNALLGQAPPGDPTNFFPAPSGGGAPNLAGQNPSTNQGCHDGWYTLSAGNVNVLDVLGLGKGEFGVTAWGGPVQYCRDFDPVAVDASSANTPPHIGALRIHRSVSEALAPGIPASNLVFTM